MKCNSITGELLAISTSDFINLVNKCEFSQAIIQNQQEKKEVQFNESVHHVTQMLQKPRNQRPLAKLNGRTL